jgi:hypothetical protein
VVVLVHLLGRSRRCRRLVCLQFTSWFTRSLTLDVWASFVQSTFKPYALNPPAPFEDSKLDITAEISRSESGSSLLLLLSVQSDLVSEAPRPTATSSQRFSLCRRELSNSKQAKQSTDAPSLLVVVLPTSSFPLVRTATYASDYAFHYDVVNTLNSGLNDGHTLFESNCCESSDASRSLCSFR